MLTRSPSSFRPGTVARLIPFALLAGLVAACADEPTAAPTRLAAGQAQRTTTTGGITITPNVLELDSGVVLTEVQAKEFTAVGFFGKPREDVEAAVVASALMGAQRTLVDYVRASVMAGRRGPDLSADARAQGRRAFKRLERGLGDYAVKR